MKTKLAITLGIIVILGGAGGGYYFYAKNTENSASKILFSPIRGTVTEQVELTGKVKVTEEISLAFEKGGRVTKVYVDTGDRVLAEQIVATLDQADALAEVNQAKAGLDAEKAKLNGLTRGTREEDIQITEAELRKANQDLQNAYMNIPDTLNDAYAKSEEAIRIKTVAMFSGTGNSSFYLTFEICDPQSKKNDVELLRLKSDIELVAWKKELDALLIDADAHVLDESLESAKRHMAIFRDFADALNNVLYTCPTSQNSATISTYGANTVLMRSNILNALSKINDLEQMITIDKTLIDQTQSTLDLKKAGNDPQQIDAQRAVVKQAEASVQQAQAQFAKTILRSPINGVITKRDIKPGEIVAPNVIAISLISDTLKIEGNIPETNYAKVALGNNARVTLDAYGESVVFITRLAKIDPAETVIEGIATYRATFDFVQPDNRVKSGMTANIAITTNEHINVLGIPLRLITREGNDRFVYVYHDNTSPEKRSITIGIIGYNGTVEIVGGLSENEKIVSPDNI